MPLDDMLGYDFGEDAVAKKSLRAAAARQQALDALAGKTGIAQVDDQVYVVPNVEYAGAVLPAVEFTTRLLDDGKSHTQADWLAFDDPDGFVVPDAELLYQVMRRAYGLRGNPLYHAQAHDVQQALEQHYDDKYLMTLTNIKYGNGTDATVSRLGQALGSASATPVKIPTFKNNHVIIAPTQAESLLGSAHVPQETQSTLQAILGAGYADAGNVFQYFASRDNGQLREARLWTPNQDSRKEYPERVVCLGVYVGFNLDADDGIDYIWPALGVRPSAQKVSSGNKGQ